MERLRVVVGALQLGLRRTASGRLAGLRLALCHAWDRTVVRLSRLRDLSVIGVVYGVFPSSLCNIENATSGGLVVLYRSDSENTVVISISTLV